MFPLDVGVSDIEKLLLVFGRVGAIIFYSPLMGRNQIPVRVKTMLALVLAFFISPLIENFSTSNSRGIFEFFVLFSTEIIIGLIIAFAVHLIFSVFQIAGSIIDVQMGFGLANVIEPQDGPKNSFSSQLQVILAILLYFAVSAHHLTVFAIVESFHLINYENFMFSQAVMLSIMDLFTSIFISAIKIAGPIMAVLFLVSMGMGLVGRAVPQMNVFFVSFPLQIGIGLLMTALTLTVFSTFAIDHISNLPVWLMSFFHSM